MRKIDISVLKDNVIDLIGKQWMLITAGNIDHYNMMTASWGTIGFLWGKPVACVVIRPQRYTLEFVEECAYNGSQYTDIEELRRMSHESFGIKVSEPGTAGCGRSL